MGETSYSFPLVSLLLFDLGVTVLIFGCYYRCWLISFYRLKHRINLYTSASFRVPFFDLIFINGDVFNLVP